MRRKNRNVRELAEIQAMAAECWGAFRKGTVPEMTRAMRMLDHWNLVEPPAIVKLLHAETMKCWAADVARSDSRTAAQILADFERAAKLADEREAATRTSSSAGGDAA
jgi:hypothetical protein